MWFVGASLASGSRGLSLVCGLSGRKGRVGQEACRWSVVCRGENAAWVKKASGVVWSVGRKGRVGQRNCRRSVVCRREKGEWVKRPVAGVWSVVAKRASGSRGLSLACGQEGQRRSVVCRAKTLRGSKKLSLECGLSGRKRCVGQEACRWRVVCRGENAAWVKRIVASVWSVVAKRASGSKKSYISYASNVANHHSDQNCQNPQNMIHLF